MVPHLMTVWSPVGMPDQHRQEAWRFVPMTLGGRAWRAWLT